MKTTERFDRAVTKLYTAFHAGELDAMDCEKCAVGNMCDNDVNWIFPVGSYGYGSLEYRVGMNAIIETGYDMYQLRKIENIFMYGGETTVFYRPERMTKQDQFNGLCKVIEYLCEIDNIPNVMDYTRLFEYEEPKYELEHAEVK